MHPTVKALLDRAEKVADCLRNAGKVDRANRFCGRAEVVIARQCARLGEVLPTLYVSGDGKWLTSWPGTKVARLETRGTARAFHTKLTCYRTTIEGRVYIGRGLGPGMYLNMRPSSR